MAGLYEYVLFCTQADIRAPVCRQFWVWVIVAALVVAALIAASIVVVVVREQLKRRAARKAQEARDAINYDEIAEYRWREDAEH